MNGVSCGDRPRRPNRTAHGSLLEHFLHFFLHAVLLRTSLLGSPKNQTPEIDALTAAGDVAMTAKAKAKALFVCLHAFMPKAGHNGEPEAHQQDWDIE